MTDDGAETDPLVLEGRNSVFVVLTLLSNIDEVILTKELGKEMSLGADLAETVRHCEIRRRPEVMELAHSVREYW